MRSNKTLFYGKIENINYKTIFIGKALKKYI